MARGRKSGPSRMDLRKQAEAAEARDTEDEDKDESDEDEEEDEDEESDEEGGEEAASEDDAGDEGSSDDDDDEDAPKKKKKKVAKPKVAKPKAPSRKKAVKEVRMRAKWVVFDNGSKRIKEFEYPNKADAEKFLADKIEEKKGTFYISLIKEPMGE
jgi:hypothetical protein